MKINEKKKLFKPADEVVENPEMIKKIGERQNRQDTECKLNERSCCIRTETNRNINPGKENHQKYR